MRTRRNHVLPDTPERRAHREAVADVERLQRKLADVRAKMAEVQRRNVRKTITIDPSIFDGVIIVNHVHPALHRPVDIIVDDPVESTCTPGEVEAVYRRLLDLRVKAPPNVYRREE